jgi:hypothetical protein
MIDRFTMRKTGIYILQSSRFAVKPGLVNGSLERVETPPGVKDARQVRQRLL